MIFIFIIPSKKTYENIDIDRALEEILEIISETSHNWQIGFNSEDLNSELFNKFKNEDFEEFGYIQAKEGIGIIISKPKKNLPNIKFLFETRIELIHNTYRFNNDK